MPMETSGNWWMAPCWKEQMVLICRIRTTNGTFEAPELCCSAIEVDENFNTVFSWSGAGLLSQILKHILKQNIFSDLPVPQIYCRDASDRGMRTEGFCHFVQFHWWESQGLGEGSNFSPHCWNMNAVVDIEATFAPTFLGMYMKKDFYVITES